MSGATALTPTFVHAVEKRMQSIQEDEYNRVLRPENVWWPKVCKSLPIDGASERLIWFLNSADIRAVGDGGEVPFEELVTQQTELVPQRYASGIRVRKDQLLDLRGGGLDILADWSRQIGAKIAYWPQRLAAEIILNGANTDGSANAYDGVPFFADNLTTTTFSGTSVTGHPYNPYRPLVGGYANWLHGSSATITQPSGATVSYPGALAIDDSVDVNTAFNNLNKGIAYSRSLRMPDGITPRFLRPACIVVPPRMIARVSQLLDAKFIAQTVGSAGGSGDVSMVIQRWGLDRAPIEAQEFGAATSYTTKIEMAAQTATGQATGVKTLYSETISGSDTTWYLVMEENMSTMLGGLIRVLREPFKVNYFFGENASSATGIDAVLNRALEIEYIAQGRESVQMGHPYGWFRFDNA